MLALLAVVTPVFLVAGAGYLLVRIGAFTDTHIDGLNRYAQVFAIPCLLFNAALNLDLGAVFEPRLLIGFYTGATVSFFLGILGARLIFKRRPGEAVVIGFGSLFSNSVILGLPIVTRAFGEETLQVAFAIISIHAPFCYLLGIVVMEASRSDGRNLGHTVRTILNAVAHNALMIGLALGFLANFLGLRLPVVAASALEMVIASALPTALIALGGVLTRYRIGARLPEAVMTSTLSLIVHPSIAFLLTYWVFGLPIVFVQAAVIIAAMAPGVNTYIFATLYNRAEGAAASTVLLATALSVLTVSGWLWILKGL